MSFRFHPGLGDGNWWDGAQAGDIRNGMLYTGSGWTSVPGATQASRAPQPNFAPAYAGVQDLNQYLAQVLEQAQNVYLGQGQGASSPAAQSQARDFAQFAREFCGLYAGAAGCGNPAAVAAQAGQQFLNYAARVDAYKANPSSQTGEPVYHQTVVPPASVPALPPVPPAAPPTAAQVVAASVRTVSAQLVNLTRPGDHFRVGDAWRLTITGQPNSAVTIAAVQNSRSLGTTPFGNTDASGTLILSGTMSAAESGQWFETIEVATARQTLSFFVYDAVATNPQIVPPPAVPPEPLEAAPSWFSDQSLIEGVPNWALVAGGAAAAFAAFGGKR